MKGLKHLFHSHRWFYCGRKNNQFTFKCEVCRKFKIINVVTEGHYTPEKIDKIIEQMENSVSHLRD